MALRRPGHESPGADCGHARDHLALDRLGRIRRDDLKVRVAKAQQGVARTEPLVRPAERRRHAEGLLGPGHPLVEIGNRVHEVIDLHC